jgi:hypothetical protein
MYTSSLVTMQPMIWVSLLFGLIMFVWSSVFRFMHHKPKNRGHVLTTKNVHFIKLSKCVTDFTIVFLLLRWSKNIYGTSNLGSGWWSYASDKISVWGPELPVCTSGLRPELPVGTGTSGLRLELLVVGGRRRSFAWKWTTGTSGLRPELPVKPDRNFW